MACMSEPIVVLARIAKINTTNGAARSKTESFELEPLAVVEMYPPKGKEPEDERNTD